MIEYIDTTAVGDTVRSKVIAHVSRPRIKMTTELYDADPDCDHVIIGGDNYSGIKCAKCTGWFCY